MDDLIDTSDAEERELMEAQKPEYHNKAWGELAPSPNSRMQDMDDVDSSIKYSRVHIPPVPASVLSAFQVRPSVVASDSQFQGRTYSLRHRTAKQLNPFEYDKRQYKHQLRRVPEAIVTEPHMNRRISRKECHSEAGENDWEEEGDLEVTEEGDDEWHVQERRKARLQDQNALDTKMRELGIEWLTSDSESEASAEAIASEGDERTRERMKRTKRKRGLRFRKFPMAVEMKNIEPSFARKSLLSPKIPPDPSPRPDQSGLSQLSPELGHTESGHASDVSNDVGYEFGCEANVVADEVVDPPRFSTHGVGPSALTDRTNSVATASEDDEPKAGYRGSRLKRGRSWRDGSDIQLLEVEREEFDHVNSDHWSEDSGTAETSARKARKQLRARWSEDSGTPKNSTVKIRKQLRALRRMMPAAFTNKLLAGKQDDSIKQNSNEYPRHRRRVHEDSPTQSGRRGNRILSPGCMDLQKNHIKGETDENQSCPYSSDHKSLVLDDDIMGADQASEQSDDRLDDDDIQVWLALEPIGEALQETLHKPRVRRPESERNRPRNGDLIDRMLQRTRRVAPQLSPPSLRSESKIKTQEAKQLHNGSERQIKLAFPRMDKQRKPSAKNPQEASPGIKSPLTQEFWEANVDDRDGRPKNNKSRRAPVRTELLIFYRDGHKVTSGRPRRMISLADDDNALHEALEPVGLTFPNNARQLFKGHAKSNHTDNPHGYRRQTATGKDVFDIEMCISSEPPNKILLDYNLTPLRPGITLGSDGYVGKGRLFELISMLKDDMEVSAPFSATIYDLQLGPDIPISQMSPTFAAACDKLYNASTVAPDDPDLPMVVKAADALMHVLCQIVTFKTLHLNDDEECLLVNGISEQLKHLISRIDERVESISADGHSLDYRSFTLYWFAVEVQMRLVRARQKRPSTAQHAISTMTQVAEQYSVQLLRRLLEYGLDRTIGWLRDGGESFPTTSTVRTLELWICLLHITPYVGTPPYTASSAPTPFWRLIEAAMDAQSNKPDSPLFQSERIWETAFSLCVISQFSIGGLSTSTVRMEAHWPMVKKALKCIRLSADDRCDNTTPVSTLQNRDAYLRLVTARCFLLCTRWKWGLDDSEDMFHELYTIFRSRNFSNLLGEPDDFPVFIRGYNEALFDRYQTNDTAYGLYLKLITRTAKNFVEKDGTSRLRSMKLNRLLGLAVPVGSTSFTKANPPTGHALSMLYNRYSAIFIAIYVDPSAMHMRSRLQQIRRYINFKDADYDSRTAAIRSMMYVAILLYRLNKPLDDILAWGSEMIDDLIAEASPSQPQDDEPSRAEREKLIVLVQLILGAIRTIITARSVSQPAAQATYPDVGFLQAWMPQLLSTTPLAKDHRTGLEICKCIESFLSARRALIQIPSIITHVNKHDTRESQDEYGDGDLDLDDPALLAFLSGIEELPNASDLDDQKASEILDGLSQPLYTCVCMHLGCKSTLFGGPYHEADQWLACWLGFGAILVRNKKRDWDYYFQLGEYAWQSITDPLRRIHLRIRFMLTVLQLDAKVYKSHEDQILKLWAESIVSPVITVENEFTARLFSIDGLRHVVLQNMPCATTSGTGDYTFSLTEFKEKRLPFIETLLCNVSNTLVNEATAGYASLIVILLSTLQSWIKDGVILKDYNEFSRKVVFAVRRQDPFNRDPALQPFLV